MMFPLVPVRCLPSDFINPFPALYATTAMCSALLLLQVLLLFLASRGTPAALQRWWQNWAKPMPLLLLISAGATVGAMGLTGWIWLQSRSFIAWVSPLPQRGSLRKMQPIMLLKVAYTSP
jgi:predicted exporter